MREGWIVYDHSYIISCLDVGEEVLFELEVVSVASRSSGTRFSATHCFFDTTSPRSYFAWVSDSSSLNSFSVTLNQCMRLVMAFKCLPFSASFGKKVCLSLLVMICKENMQGVVRNITILMSTFDCSFGIDVEKWLDLVDSSTEICEVLWWWHRQQSLLTSKQKRFHSIQAVDEKVFPKWSKDCFCHLCSRPPSPQMIKVLFFVSLSTHCWISWEYSSIISQTGSNHCLIIESYS